MKHSRRYSPFTLGLVTDLDTPFRLPKFPFKTSNEILYLKKKTLLMNRKWRAFEWTEEM